MVSDAEMSKAGACASRHDKVLDHPISDQAVCSCSDVYKPVRIFRMSYLRNASAPFLILPLAIVFSLQHLM